MKVATLEQIKDALPGLDLMSEIEAGFVAYSRGEAVVPPVGELLFEDPPGDVHIKYGYLKGDDYYVIKIASGFFENANRGFPTTNGMMLLFSQETGWPRAILLDEGYLTDVRTAVAGAIAAKHLAPPTVSRVGIVGTGTQARLQLEYLAPVTDCRNVLAWGREQAKLDSYKSDMEERGFAVSTTLDATELMASCELIVTTTPSEKPILQWPGAIDHGIHITAMGSDTQHKQELDSQILSHADLIVADSVSQCLERGEIHKAMQQGTIDAGPVVELGKIIAGDIKGRTSDDQLTIADLTGVAVQDIQITKAVYEALA